jgi:CPA2 family monovalent cation:H+ antiporter-2
MAHVHFLELILLLSTSVFIVWFFKRIALPPVLAYLVAGIVAGPQVLGLLSDPTQVALVGELGVVFLLFSLGLEFSIPKLIAMRHLVFVVGGVQVLLTLLLVMISAFFMGVGWTNAFIIGCIFALSSTAVVVKCLNESGLLQTKRGQVAISILLFQDIAVVPFLIAIPLLAGNGDGNILTAIGLALSKGALVVVILLSVGKWVLPKVFNEVAQVRTDELFVLTAILVTVMAGTLTSFFGLSMALGAFLAGMMLSESQYKHQLEADIKPFRDILMGLFFISVGMNLDVTVIVRHFEWILAGLLTLLIIKTIVIKQIAVISGESQRDGWSAGIMLFQMGEFGFVLVALAQQENLFNADLASALVAIGVLSMAMTPSMITRHLSIVDGINRILKNQSAENEEPREADFESNLSKHVIICGFGRVGQIVSRFLKSEAVPYLALDVDPVRVAEAQAAGENVQFGHARDKSILEAAGAERAKLIVITFGDVARTQAVINNVRELNKSARIMVRTKTDEHLKLMLSEGADQVVPEALEGSLMLVSQVLFESGVPMSRVLKRIRKERENRYGHLHGFYPGDTTEVTAERRDLLEFIHAINIPGNAFAVNKTIAELELSRRRVEIVGLRRGGAEIATPEESTQILANDVIVIKGKPRRVERVERYILTG